MREPQFILASASPRRAELLRECGVTDFRIVVPEVEELTADAPFSTFEIPRINAERKADAVAAQFPDAMVLGADTVIVLGESVIGKPVDTNDARAILRRLSGKSHAVVTGVCLCRKNHGIRVSFLEKSHVHFRVLTDEDISRYLSLVHVLDKAGAYAIQEHGDLLIESVSGSRSNIIGLPVERVREMFRAVLR